MIVYADRRARAETRALVGALARLVEAGDDAGALIEAGTLEAAVADALGPAMDDDPEAARALGAVTLALARAARGDGEAGRWRGAARDALRRLPVLPATVEVGEPEGFAFYALYPETYATAARLALAALRPERVLVLGLRGIGATLAAVVAAELEAAGVATRVLTVRPRGHPWDRRLVLGPRARAALEDGARGTVLVVDEGPGISGTSFACAAEAAVGAGATRVALLPSWDCDGSGLRSERGRAAFARHPRFVASFEDTVLPRLAAGWGGAEDWGGGAWRRALMPEGGWPAAHPHHERRKFRTPDGLRRFAGLGARGERAFHRARAQAAAGLAPEPDGLADGFLALRLAPGRPARAADLDAGLLDAMARHLAWVAGQPPTGPARFDEAAGMIRANLGEAGLDAPSWLDGCRAAVEARPARAVDGRMGPAEWIRGERTLKVDGLDHHDDHFWPGTQDVAWDLAGAAAEWGMGEGAAAGLLARYEAATGDRGARHVLPFHALAFLAWRLGYAALAAETAGEDGPRFAALRDRMAARAARVIATGGWA